MYEDQRYLLQFWIDHWDVVVDEESYLKAVSTSEVLIGCDLWDGVSVKDGLCLNANLYKMDSTTKGAMFKSWSGFSGSYMYPVEGCGVEYRFMVCMTNNHKRLDLAKHCLQYLKDLHEKTENNGSQYEF